ncbi:electron transfer flavoprotein subunit alpha/FixB family protein [Desulfothermus naphthae]
MEKNIMVFLEYKKGKLQDVSKELLSKARSLAKKLGSKVLGLAVGYNLKNLAELGEYGADRIIYVSNKELSLYRSIPFAKTVVSAILHYRPYIVLFGATHIGRDLAPRVASCLQAGLTADCTELKIGDYKTGKILYKDQLLQIRPAWGGNIIATIVSPESNPSIATVREGVIAIDKIISGKKAEVEDFSVEFSKQDLVTEIIEQSIEERDGDLKGAKIVIGAGMGAAEDYIMDLIFQLAKLLKAEVGGSRPLIDAGFLSPHRQIGQTGVTIRPNLYIALGISGQVQHLVGIMNSKRILAINKDPEAPIFDVAHYKIVGDLKDVLPIMIKAYKDMLKKI